MKAEPQMDIELVVRCRRGDEAAFDELYDRFGQMVWRLCVRMACKPSDAEDLAQETWIQVWTRIGTYRCESSFPTWLYKVATNVCLQQLRRESRNRVHSIEDVDEHSSGRGDPEGRLEAQSIAAEIRRLPDTLRLPLILRAYEELSYAEIADILDCTTAAVKMRMARARLTLAKALEVEIG